MSQDFWKVRKGVVIKSVPSDPSSPEDGSIWYNSTLGKFRKREDGVTKNLDDSGSDVHGPGPTTANSVAIFSDTSGQSLNDTDIIVTGGEDLSGINDLDMDGDLTIGGTLTIGGSEVVTVDDTQTLTNKTIDGDDNTVQDLALTSLKTNLTDASKFLVRDASGIVVSNTKAVPAGAVVGTTDSQTLTGKTIDGDDNTVQDLALSSLKTVGGDANKFVVRNGSGAVISSNTVPAGTVVGTSDSQTLTNKTIDADANTITNIENADIKAGAAIDAAKIHDGSVSNTEFGYLDGVTSAIQTQLNNKLNLSGGTLTGFLTLHADPTNALHAATKQYVDGLNNGLDWKNSVKAASTANLTLSGEQTVDGVSLVNGDRVLVKNQTAPAENGIYVVAVGAWSRSLDMDSWSEVPASAVFVEQGSTQADRGYVCTSDQGGTLGTTAITWVQFSSASSYVAGNGIDITGQTISVIHDGEGLTFSGSNLALELDGSTLSKSASGVKVADGGITNTQVNASAAIAYSKLNLTGSIVNADVNASAAIAYSKLNLSNSILNADINASAAIAYSKLNLSNSILNADINASAAIAYSKLNLTGSIVNADINASAAIAYSKLNLTGSIVNADINASAAIAGTKISPDFGSQNIVTTGQYRLPDGSSGTLALAFSNQTSMGFYRVSADHLRYQGVDDTIFSIYNPGTNDSSILMLTNNGSSTGDQYIYFIESGVTSSQWALGRDDSDSGAFKLSQSSSPGTNDFLKVTAAGNITLGPALEVQIDADELSYVKSSSGSNIYVSVQNNSNTASSQAVLLSSVAGSSAGDAYTWYQISGVQSWVTGTDNSDSDSFKISASSALGTSDRLKITVAGALTLGESGGTQTHTINGSFLDIGSSHASNNNTLHIFNTDNTSATSHARTRARVGGSSGGDAFATYEIASGQAWSLGLDNSDSDSFKVSASSTLGSSDLLTISTAGALTLGASGGSQTHQIYGQTLQFNAPSGGAAALQIQSEGSDNSAVIRLHTQETATTADPYILFRNDDTTNPWSVGRDTSASNAFKISNSSTLGTNDYLSVSTAGALTLGASGGSQTHAINGYQITHANARAGANMRIVHRNTQAADVSSGAEIFIQVEPACGDAYIGFNVNGAANWDLGVDNSDSDSFKLFHGGSAGGLMEGTNFLKIDTSGSWTLTNAGSVEINSPTAGSGLLSFQQNGAGNDQIIRSYNFDNTNASSNATVRAQTGGASGGDPKLTLVIDGATSWHVGADNSDSDAFSIGDSATVGASQKFKISTAGALTLGASGGSQTHVVRGRDLVTTATLSGDQVTVQATNDSNTASSIAYMRTAVAGTSAGDPYFICDITGGQTWSFGADNSASDAFKISASTALGTSDRLSISTAGDVAVLSGDLSISTAGKGLKVAEGSNAKMGVSTLVAGTVTVSTTAVTANSRIFLTGQNSSGTHGELTVSARTASTSFTITSTSALDTRDVAWMLVEPA